jgi:UDPglucose 6-dehydrogenase
LPGQVSYFTDVYDTVTAADAVVLMTEWNEYRGLDLGRMKELMRGNTFIDLRNVYERSQLAESGFEYFCVGR